jgi:hypothetical protein
MFFAAMLGMLTGVAATVALGVGCVFGMGGIFLRVFGVGTLVMRVLFVDFHAGWCRGGRCLDRRHFRLVFRRVGFARDVVVVVRIMRMVMLMRMLVIAVIMMLRIGVVMFGLARVIVGMFAVPIFMRLSRLRRIGAGVLDDLALDAFAVAAAARIAMTRTTAAAGTVFGFFFGFAMGAFVGFDQRLTVGDRNLIVIGMDFAEGQKAVTVATIFNEGGLQ